MKTSDIKKMSVAQRLQAMESLWDSFLYEGTEVESPQWHGEILSQRKAKIASGKANFMSLDKLKKYR
jgi:hypothetical protein